MKLTTENRIAIMLHDGVRDVSGKTGLAFLRYGSSPVVAVIDQDCPGESLFNLTGIDRDVPIVASVEAALAYDPDVLMIGIAPSGGRLPPEWAKQVQQALFAGISVVNGLHTPMAGLKDQLPDGKLHSGQWIWDIRQEPQDLSIGSGKARSLSCQRILTVGTDMAIGKMSASLTLYQTVQKRGINTKFVATGQAGLMISGTGVPLDAVRVDFAAGAVEKAVLETGQDCDLLFIEGQGSLLHPGSTATLPLLRGAQPTGLILVHQAQNKHIKTCPDIPIPPLSDVVQMYESVAAAAGAFSGAIVQGIALNTFHLDQSSAEAEINAIESETGLPCTDVIRFGADRLLDAILR